MVGLNIIMGSDLICDKLDTFSKISLLSPYSRGLFY